MGVDGYRLIENPFRTGVPDLRRLSGPVVSAADAGLLAPVEPRTVVGMAHNTGPADRACAPEAFLKPARSVVGPGVAIELPAGIGRVDAEAELAAVIAADGSVFGWTLANDVTARDLQATDARWARAKGYPTFTPVGPWIETSLDPETVELELVLDGRAARAGRPTPACTERPRGARLPDTFLPLGAQDLVLVGAPGTVRPARRPAARSRSAARSSAR